MNTPYLITDNEKINTAYRMAMGTLVSNILPFRDGILTEEKPVIIAGLGYDTPWTRDTAINIWNCGGFLCPDVSLNTLQSVMGKNEKGYFIDGQYWDAIIWVTGAWNYYLYTGDKEFLSMAYEASVNSLEFFEDTEFDSEIGLFRGAACYGDGVAAYPDIYASHGFSGITWFPTECPELCADKGVGTPMFALSTNCLYYGAYVLVDKMAKILGKPQLYADKAEAIRKNINEVFWNEGKGTYNYLHDPFGGCDYQEGMGIAFVILYGVADEEQIKKVLKNAHVTPHGMPCVWPTFERYIINDPEKDFGRHSGTIWPHIQGFWADAAAMTGNSEIFDNEFKAQTDNAVDNYQFAEIYHPMTGEIYGGWQEDNQDGIFLSYPQPHQTWSATAYLRNVYMNLLGMKFEEDGVRFSPVKTKLLNEIKLLGFRYRGAVLDICITRTQEDSCFMIDGVESEPFVSSGMSGVHQIVIKL